MGLDVTPHFTDGWHSPWKHGDWEKWKNAPAVLDDAFPYVKDFDCAIDGGAFIGMWSRKLASKFNIVHAFEILPVNFKYLRMNVPENVIVHHQGLAHESIELPIGRVDTSPFGWFGGRPKPIIGKVGCIALDSLSLKPGLIKLDLDGFESIAISGMVKTFKHNPVLVIEDKPHIRERYNAPDHMQYLRSIGYKTVKRTGLDHIMVRNG